MIYVRIWIIILLLLAVLWLVVNWAISIPREYKICVVSFACVSRHVLLTAHVLCVYAHMYNVRGNRASGNTEQQTMRYMIGVCAYMYEQHLCIRTVHVLYI